MGFLQDIFANSFLAYEFFSYESNQLTSTCLPLVGEGKIENVPCKRRCLQNITNNETRPCSAKEFQTPEPSFVGSCGGNHEGVDSQPVECELSFNSGSALSSTELFLYSMHLAFRVSTFSKHHSFGSYHHRIGIITEVPLLSEPLMSMGPHVASRILAAILLASKNGGFNRVLLGSSLQKLDYQ